MPLARDSKRVRKAHVDGWCILEKYTTIRNENKLKIGEDYVELTRAPFEDGKLTLIDIQQLDTIINRVSIKIRVPQNPVYDDYEKGTLYVTVRNVRYRLINIDIDRPYYFLYLEKLTKGKGVSVHG